MGQYISTCYGVTLDDASDQYISCGSKSILNFVPTLNQFTVAVWLRGTGGSAGAATKIVFSRSTDTLKQYELAFDHFGRTATLTMGGTSKEIDVQGGPLGAGIWDSYLFRHIVVVVDAAEARLYVNGQWHSPALTLSGTTMAAVDTLIGARRDTNNTDWADICDASTFADVAFWDEAIGAAEVLALYNGGDPLDPREDSGSYVSSANLVALYGMGDGDLEQAHLPVGTPNIEDRSVNNNQATIYEGATPPPTWNYTTLGNLGTCIPLEFESSSSAFVMPVTSSPTFTVYHRNQGTLKSLKGIEGSLLRANFECEVSHPNLLDKNIFVIEYGRPVPGTSLRREVFRRVATLTDMIDLGIGRANRQSVFPHAYRTHIASVYGATENDLTAAWIEIQRQCSVLSLDMIEFGVPYDGVMSGGADEEYPVGSEAFSIPLPIRMSSSSAAATPVVPVGMSSSSSLVAAPQSSSAGAEVPGSSSSAWVDPHLFSETIYLENPTAGDAATRLDDDGAQTIFHDLGFLRFGRNNYPLETWDSFMRFPIVLPKCASILSAYVYFTTHTSEYGADVVLKIRDAYQDATGYQTVGKFLTTSDPKYRDEVVWDRLAGYLAGRVMVSPDLADLLQFFVDRDEYNPAGDYFGLWIAEITSDPGARRDATMGLVTPYLAVTYRDDRICPSSSSAGA